MFSNCKLLTSLPDISVWNTSNVKDMSYLFNKCIKIILIDKKFISNMRYMFYNCESLSSLPDISKWNTNNVTNMSFIFYNCKSLSSLPDISNWDTNMLLI